LFLSEVDSDRFRGIVTLRVKRLKTFSVARDLKTEVMTKVTSDSSVRRKVNESRRSYYSS